MASEGRIAIGAMLALAGLLAGMPSCGSFDESRTPDDAGATDGSPGDGAPDEGAPDDGAAADGAAADAGADSGGPTPVELVKGEGKLLRLATGAKHVYYTQDVPGGNVMRVAKSGASGATAFVPGLQPSGLAVSATTVYVSSRAQKSVTSWDASSGSAGLLLTIDSPAALIVDPIALVFLDDGASKPGAFSVLPALGGGITEATTAGQPVALAMNVGSLFVAFNAVNGTQVVRRWTRGGPSGAAAMSANFGAFLTAVDVDLSWVYVGTGSEVRTLPLAFSEGAQPSVIHDFGVGTLVTAIRSGPLLTFVATQGGAQGGAIYTLPAAAKAGARTPTLFASLPGCEIPDMVTEPDAVYVLCMKAGVGSVWSVARK